MLMTRMMMIIMMMTHTLLFLVLDGLVVVVVVVVGHSQEDHCFELERQLGEEMVLVLVLAYAHVSVQGSEAL
jgi:hypothetical protein